MPPRHENHGRDARVDVYLVNTNQRIESPLSAFPAHYLPLSGRLDLPRSSRTVTVGCAGGRVHACGSYCARMLIPRWRCCMKPMMALSMTFASPVAMKPPRVIASWIGSRQRAPMSASLGNQSKNAARSLGTIFWPVKNAKVDHPGNLGGHETWKDAGSWQHRRSIRMSCANAR